MKDEQKSTIDQEDYFWMAVSERSLYFWMDPSNDAYEELKSD